MLKIKIEIVCKNIVHVGVAGFVAYWYCERPENAIIISRNMIYRCIVSFGSICLGSLLFPPIHIIRSLSLYLSRLSDYHPVSINNNMEIFNNYLIIVF